jgi:hypothetical protein
MKESKRKNPAVPFYALSPLGLFIFGESENFPQKNKF